MPMPAQRVVGTARIEFWPLNGRAQHVVVIDDRGRRLCFAYASREIAEQRIDDMAFCWGIRWDEKIEVLRP